MSFPSSVSRPERFYKYTSADGARKMLSTLRAWWKYPPLLDDPFDMQIAPLLGCTVDEIATESVPRAERFLRSNQPPPSRMDPVLAQVLTTFRPYASVLDVPNEARAFAAALLEAMRASPGISNALTNAQAQWQGWLRGIRVFCVSATKANLLMWSLYGQSHQGAVLEMRPLPGERGALRGAFPMTYAPKMPVMGSAQQWADHVFGRASIDFGAFFDALIYTKGKDWEHQEEWRCFVSEADGKLDVPDMPGVWACPILPDEVTAVYLGCKMSPEDRAAIRDLVRTSVPHAAVHEAILVADRFELEFR